MRRSRGEIYAHPQVAEDLETYERRGSHAELGLGALNHFGHRRPAGVGDVSVITRRAKSTQCTYDVAVTMCRERRYDDGTLLRHKQAVALTLLRVF